MKQALILIVLLIVVIAVSARLPRKPGKHGPKKPSGCQLHNCKKCRSKPFSCDECDHGFVREKVPLGYACRETCSPGLYSVQGTCVGKQDCPLNCKTCQNRLSCSVCESGHVLYQRVGRCIKKCPNGFKPKVNPMGGKKCVKSCTANCKLCQGRSCSVCEHGHALYKGYHQRGKGVCVKKCPTGYRVKLNPVGGNECVRDCTANCKTCQGNICSVCEQGHALYKGSGRFGKGRCLRKCPKGYKTGVNPSGGNKCVRSCVVANCESCPRSWTNQPKCTRCESGFYRLSIGKSWKQYDFCFSHCPAGYVPKNVKGVAQCQKREPETEHSTTTESTTTEESTTVFICNTRPYATTEADWTPSEEPTSVPGSSTTSPPSATPEPITEPEPSTIFTDFWP